MASEEYEIEKVVGKRFINCKPEYLVKWLNYPENQNTWESIQNFRQCPSVIQDFEKTNYILAKCNNLLKKKITKQKVDNNEKKSKKQIKNKETETVQDELSSNLEDNKNLGHLKFGDQIKKIINAIQPNKKSKRIQYLVEWTQRPDGIQPQNSLIDNYEFRKYNHEFLLNFYEKRLKFVPDDK